MGGVRWSLEHKRLLHTNLSSERIAEITGRPLSAVQRTRYHYTGHHVSRDQAYLTKPERMSKVEGECRIIEMCKKLHVRLLDE